MNVASLEWVLGILLVSAFFFLTTKVWHRQVLYALCSISFLAAHSLSWSAWILLAAFLGSGYLIAKWLENRPSGSLLAIYLLIVVGSFIFFKQYSFLKEILPDNLFSLKITLIGISYMLFRQIHLTVDAYQGQIQNLTLWNYLNYQLNLFGLQAGPIQRYQEFSDHWVRLDPIRTSYTEILRTYLRLFFGVIKVLGIGAWCLAIYSRTLDRYFAASGGLETFLLFLLSIYVFTAYLYFNFSGYCDIVISAAGLVGMKMPENFQLPFLSRNIGELWTRWHRTLGFWIRDYLFTPIFKASVERLPRHATTLSFSAYFLAFSLAGLWHGSTWNFLVFGLLHGAAVASAKIWEMFLLRRLGRPGFKLYLQNPRIKLVAQIATFHYFAFTLIFWYHDMAGSGAILRKLTLAITH